MNRARILRLSTVTAIVAMLTLTVFGPNARVATAAPGSDVCAESNDSFESSCYLGPNADVYGFLSFEDDVDMYRVEPLEFGVKLHIALTEQPFPYRIGVFNWEGKVVADTTDAGTPTLDLQLGPPGSYYVAVKQAFQGQVSATAPYRLVSDLRYPGKTPSVAYSATFRPDGHEANDYDLAPDEDADYELGNGRLTIRLKQGGSAKDPSFAGYWLPIGANISNFTLALDARIANDTDAGYDIKFRSPNDADDETGYHLVVNPKEQQIKLRSVNIEDDVHHSLGKWITSPVINAQGSNRIVVRAQGDDIRVNVNGTELIHARDSSFAEGAISFQALGWGDQPPAVNFGNILVTTP